MQSMASKNNIPTEQECYNLMNMYGMYPHIMEHSKQVRNVSLAIINALKKPNSVNRQLILSAALLHDIAKTRCIQTGEKRHDMIGGQILRDRGLIAIAYIVECHVFFPDYNHNGSLEEREIVYYADKRVKHDKIVSIDERVDDLVKRYGKTERIKQLILENKKFVQQLELKIQRFMRVDIDAALRLL